jgi:hypothetical protein
VRLLALAAAFAALATVAPAAPASSKARFRVALEGLVRTVWAQETFYEQDGCDFTMRTSGHKLIAFHSRRPSTALLSPGGFRLTLGAIEGEIAGSGGSGTALSEECGDLTHWDGLPLLARFGNARLTVSKPRKGPVRLSDLRPGIPDRAAWAPTVFGDVRPPLELALGAVDEARLANPRTRKIVVTGSYGNVVRLAGDASGNVRQDVSWKLTLTRVER